MEPKFQTSFIPKKPLVSVAGASASGVNSLHETNVISIIATILFVVILFVSGGLFGYKILLTQQIEEADQNINAARESFELDLIRDMIEANSRIESVKGLLEAHVVASELLYLLEDLTVQRIRIKELEYIKQGRTPIITFEGESLSYNAVAQQNQIFGANDYILSGRFADLGPNKEGLIDLSFSGEIDPSLISYKRAIEDLSTGNFEQSVSAEESFVTEPLP